MVHASLTHLSLQMISENQQQRKCDVFASWISKFGWTAQGDRTRWNQWIFITQNPRHFWSWWPIWCWDRNLWHHCRRPKTKIGRPLAHKHPDNLNTTSQIIRQMPCLRRRAKELSTGPFAIFRRRVLCHFLRIFFASCCARFFLLQCVEQV